MTDGLLDMGFWTELVILVFFVYGLAFYSLGLALLVESGRSSEMGFARSMRLLAAFGLLHGIHEWIDMLEHSCNCVLDLTLPGFILWLRLLLLVTSFVALAAFGEDLIARQHGMAQSFKRWRITLSLITFFAVSSILIALYYNLDDMTWRLGMEVLARYTLGIPAALLATYALWLQRSVFLENKMRGFARWLDVAAAALLVYGTFSQLFTASTPVFPSNLINANLFMDTLGFPIQLVRAVLACLIMVAMIQVLRSLEVENERRLQRYEQQQLQAERQQRKELTRLNEELRQANIETERLLMEVRQRDALRGEWVQRITNAQEAERQRIARELHDDTGQVLTGLALGLRGIAHLVETDVAKGVNRLSDLERMATNGIADLRHLINDLRPPQLDDIGLVSALRVMVTRVRDVRGNELAIELSVRGDVVDLSPEVEIALFRIVQESLTNTIKHAHASRIEIKLDYTENLNITIQDNGSGFDAEKLLTDDGIHTSWGLYGMRERANLVNADLVIQSKPGQGTLIGIQLHDNNYQNIQEQI